MNDLENYLSDFQPPEYRGVLSPFERLIIYDEHIQKIRALNEYAKQVAVENVRQKRTRRDPS